MKKAVTALLAAVMIIAAATGTVMVSAADFESELIGYYKFEGNLRNEIGADSARFTGQTLGETYDESPMYEPGYKSYAFYAMSDVGDGLKLDCAPADNTYTVSVWAKAETCAFAAPIIWVGSETHTDASYDKWLGVWADFDGASWASTPSIGSNDEKNSKVGAVPESGLSDDTTFGWTLITLTVNEGVGTLYFNGDKAADTVENFARSLPGWGDANGATELPLMFGSDGYDDCAIYLAVNAWDAPPTIYYDEVRVYDRVLTGDDVAALFASYDGTVPADEDPNFTPDTAPGAEDTAPDTQTPETNAPDTAAPDTIADTEPDGDNEKDGDGDKASAASPAMSPVLWVTFGIIWAALIIAIIIIIVKRRK